MAANTKAEQLADILRLEQVEQAKFLRDGSLIVHTHTLIADGKYELGQYELVLSKLVPSKEAKEPARIRNKTRVVHGNSNYGTVHDIHHPVVWVDGQRQHW